MDFNTRELALLIWIMLSVIGILCFKKTRPSALAVARAFFQTKIIDVLGLAALYTAACVWALARFGVWDWPNLKTVIVWYFTTALVAMASTRKLERGPVTMLAIAKEAVAATAIVQFIGNMATFPLWGELLLVPVLTLLGLLVAVAELKPEHRKIIAPLNTLIVMLGLYIVGYSIYEVIIGWNRLDAEFQVREFALPIFLTLMFLPFLYGLIAYMGFENAAVRLQFKIEDRALRRYIWFRGILAFGANVEIFGRFIHAIQMSDVTDRAGVRAVVETLRRARQREKCPPLVEWREGWSPYSAREFLAEQGLRTNHYHPTAIDWSADSPYLKLSDGVLPDHLIYRIAGTEAAATQLTLELDVNAPEPSEEGDQRFWVTSCALVLRALGDEPALRFAKAVPTDAPMRMEAGDLTILVERDGWNNGDRGHYSRTLTILHPAHKDPFAEFK